MSWLSSVLQRQWYKPTFSAVLLPLQPLAALYSVLSRANKIKSLRHQAEHSVPIWVVGNISVGGTGKTPVTLALVKYCQEKNIHVGIVSRGYGGSEGKGDAFIIDSQSTVQQAGDEPLLMYQRLNCPVVICAKRNHAITALLAKFPKTQLILSDDGLQHYAMPRQLEIAVVDGQRGLGNQALLPAGPLRESAQRLSSVDMIIHNGAMSAGCELSLQAHSHKTFGMTLSASALVPLNKLDEVQPIKGDTVHAVAGIGNPQRFFNALKEQGFNIIEHSFADHYHYQSQDLQFDDGLAIIMTEKDAVKCASLVLPSACYYLPVDAVFSSEFYEKLETLLQHI